MPPIASISVCGYNASLAVHAASDKAAPTILALHGFTGSGQDFLHLRDEIGHQAAHWVCPDFMGHGRSDSPPILDPYQLPATLRLIDAARQMAPNPDRVLLLGYSMGGRLGLHYLHRAKPLPAVLISASPGLATHQERANRRQADQKWIRLLNRTGSMDRFAREWEKQSLIEPQTRLPEPIRSDVAQRRRANNPLGLAHSLLGTGTGALPSLWNALDGLPPLTLAYGIFDTKFATIANQMAAYNDRFHLTELSNAGHAAHLEAPSEVAKILSGLMAYAW